MIEIKIKDTLRYKIYKRFRDFDSFNEAVIIFIKTNMNNS